MISIKKFIIVVTINLAIALGYLYDGFTANVTDISSDLANIIPICKKLDNPNLYQNDLYLSEIADVQYYTPFYVESLRFFAKFTNGDYIQALNFISFITHLAYGILWFLFFYTLRKDFIIALAFSLFFRGILWPPGGELLGISDMWTIMPRTVFIAFAPLPFILYNHVKRFKITISAVVMGLLLNLHPLSGVGVIVVYFTVFVLSEYYNNRFGRSTFYKLFLGLVCCLAGALPYLFTYFSNINTDLIFSTDLFNEAFSRRISPIFSNPILFIQSWYRPILVCLLLLFAIFYFFDSSHQKKNFKIILIAAVTLLLVANGTVYIENALNSILDKNIRMAFQLIRFQKFILVLLQIGLYLLICDIAVKFSLGKTVKSFLGFSFAIVVILSSLPAFKRLPVIGEDFITSILPASLKLAPSKSPTSNSDLASMITYIKQNTDQNGVFYGSYLIRSGADRSVQFDSKGAGMLIEGNLNKFITWYLDEKKLNSLPPDEKINFLKEYHVNYILSDKGWSDLTPIHTVGNFNLYKL